MLSRRTAFRLVHWGLLATSLLVVVSGLGITEFRAVETLTFGLLNKASAFRLHLWVWIPFLVLLATHVLLTAAPARFRRKR